MRKEQLARRHGQRCTYCRCPFADLSEATLDHIAPCSLWWSWSVTSLMLACFDCNQAKADRLPLSLALLLLRWADPTVPVVRPADWPLLAGLAADHRTALASVTARVTPDVTPHPVDLESTSDQPESTCHSPSTRQWSDRPDYPRAPRPIRACDGSTGEGVAA
ncbi:HNH endonuclease [Streptomyces sp. NBC_00659]|uniref:HNH endonuclease n=1 Tax=Streptomyces sp. NBC_00659 TaxID=2903669 RepID=UPI002E3603FF|nr:HNH endonuclease [Streptomyces sp. NBC_00659]